MRRSSSERGRWRWFFILFTAIGGALLFLVGSAWLEEEHPDGTFAAVRDRIFFFEGKTLHLAEALRDGNSAYPCDLLDYGGLDKLRSDPTQICLTSGLLHTLTSSGLLFRGQPEIGGCGELSVMFEARNVLYASPDGRELLLRCSGGLESSSEHFPRLTNKVKLSAVSEVEAEPSGGWIERNTFAIIAFRKDFFTNLYHTIEELFAMFQSAAVVKEHMSSFQLLVVMGQSASTRAGGGLYGFLISGGRVSWIGGEQKDKTRHQLLELWSRVLFDPTKPKVDHDSERLLSLVKPNVTVGFRRLVMPLRACHGSVLPASWGGRAQCPGGLALAKDVATHVVASFGLNPAASTSSSTVGSREFLAPTLQPGPRLVTFILRTGKRRLLNMAQARLALELLPARLQVVPVELGELSFAEQISLVHNSSVLVGVHGAGLTHLLFLPAGAVVVEISAFPPPVGSRRVENIFMNLASWVDRRYVSVQGAGSHEGAVTVNPGTLAEAVSKALR